MILETQKQIEETPEPNVLRDSLAGAPVKQISHAFQKLDGLGRTGEGPQLLAFAIALLIWLALCGLLRLVLRLLNIGLITQVDGMMQTLALPE
jgi:hypothetical protein